MATLKAKLFSKMGTFLVEVFKQYNWRKVVVISSTYFIWQEAATAIRKVNTGVTRCNRYTGVINWRIIVLGCISCNACCHVTL